MHEHIKSYFQPSEEGSSAGRFRRVIALHEERTHDWTDLKELCPELPRGWFELATLQLRDRIDFTRDYWMMKLPFHTEVSSFILDFFASLDDIGVYLTQSITEKTWQVHMVYSVKDDRSFFRGCPGATKETMDTLKVQFAEFILPADYLAFLEIHDGFYKYTDTGIVPAKQLWKSTLDFQARLETMPPLIAADGAQVNPKRLIPFYESFGFPCYQCFWADWYPQNEMGNVYYSGLTHTLSDHRSNKTSPEHMAFPTFLDWLMFYLETIKA